MSGLETQLADRITEGRVKPCRSCNETGGLYPIATEGMHAAKIVCVYCDDRFHGWLPKPASRPKRDGNSTRLLNLVREARDGEPLYCDICLRDERWLPKGVWMEAHHIVEHQDAGNDTVANLQPLCNECHALVHWRRRTVAGEQVAKPGTWEISDAPS